MSPDVPVRSHSVALLVLLLLDCIHTSAVARADRCFTPLTPTLVLLLGVGRVLRRGTGFPAGMVRALEVTLRLVAWSHVSTTCLDRVERVPELSVLAFERVGDVLALDQLSLASLDVLLQVDNFLQQVFPLVT